MKINYSRSALAIIIMTSINVNAELYKVEKTKVDNINVNNTQLNENEVSYTIQGLNVVLTQEDRIKAKGWKLNEEEYAQYLFIMKYTPRGLWSPEIDPPIALGNEATTDKERMYYAEKMNGIEWDRRQKEAAFQKAGIKDIDSRLMQQGYVKTKDRPPVTKGQFSKTLPDKKMELRSVFVDMSDCEQDCKLWVTKQIMLTGTKTQLDLFVANGQDLKNSDLYKLFAIPPSKVTGGEINISRSTDMVEAYKKGWRTPFVIRRSDEQTTRKGLYEKDKK